MVLRARNPILAELARVARRSQAYRTTHAQLDDDLGVQSQGAGGEVHQAGDNDVAFPAGFFCKQAAEDEEITVPCRAGDVVVAFRISPPSDVASANAREPVLWDPSGNRIRCNGTAGTEVTVAAGGVHKVRSDGGTTQKVAQAPATKTEIQALIDYVMAHNHTHPQGPTTGLTDAGPSDCGTIAAAVLEAE